MRLGRVRRPLAISLYVLAGLGGLCGVLTVVAIRQNLDHNVTGDVTGAALATSFLLIAILPLTLVALSLALWLAPPWRSRRRRNDPGSVEARGERVQPPARDPHPGLAAGLLVAAAVLVAAVGTMLTSALRATHQHYGTHGVELVRLGLQDLILFAPLLLLAAVLGSIGCAMLRRGRPRE